MLDKKDLAGPPADRSSPRAAERLRPFIIAGRRLLLETFKRQSRRPLRAGVFARPVPGIIYGVTVAGRRTRGPFSVLPIRVLRTIS